MAACPPEKNNEMVLKWGFEFDRFQKPFAKQALPSAFSSKITYKDFEQLKELFDKCQDAKDIYTSNFRNCLFWTVLIILGSIYGILMLLMIAVLMATSRDKNNGGGFMILVITLIFYGLYYLFMKIYVSTRWEMDFARVQRRGRNLRMLVGQLNEQYKDRKITFKTVFFGAYIIMDVVR